MWHTVTYELYVVNKIQNAISPLSSFKCAAHCHRWWKWTKTPSPLSHTHHHCSDFLSTTNIMTSTPNNSTTIKNNQQNIYFICRSKYIQLGHCSSKGALRGWDTRPRDLREMRWHFRYVSAWIQSYTNKLAREHCKNLCFIISPVM